MEESSGVHYEENKASMEKDRKRRLKTPAQVMALEKFYDDHKYPTEEMKSQLAEQIGLTEKQISGWFCHRRLKDKKLFRDEACPSGRQDHSGAVIQDRGSGLVQDSCGSTKHGDYRHIDPREVESRRLYRNDFQVAGLTYEHMTRYTGTVSGTDNTSSESSSSSQDRLVCQTEDPDDRKNSRYPTHNGLGAPINATCEKVIGYKPSGYLKVKGEIENAAVTAVKRQLGRYYREDGPLLGVEFQPLPPGAFESPIRNPIHGFSQEREIMKVEEVVEKEPYCVGNPSHSHSPDISGQERQPSLSNDLYMERENCGSMHGSDYRDKISHPQFKQNSTVLNHTKPFCKRNSFSDLYEDSAGETNVYSSKRNQRMSSKHDVEGLRTEAIANHHSHYDGKIESEMHDFDHVSPNTIHMSENFKSKPSIFIHNPCEAFDTETEERSMRIKKKEKVNGKFNGRKEYGNQVNLKMHPTKGMMVAKRVRPDLPKADYLKKASFTGMPPTWKHRSKGSVMEIPSSFSKDETAETSRSLE